MGTELEQLKILSQSIGIHWSKILRVEGKLEQIDEKMETNYISISVRGSMYVKSEGSKLRE